jgi:[ribosomal protein S18]-alanine N-acetyltransferase
MSEGDYRHISILWATPADAGEISALHASLFDKAWDAESIASHLQHPGAISLLARLGAPPRTAGFILARVAADEAEILSLGVRGSDQRRGIARRLVEALRRAAGKAEARRLFLEVGQGNAAANALYASLGFQEVGRRKGYYEHAGGAEDARVLALRL